MDLRVFSGEECSLPTSVHDTKENSKPLCWQNQPFGWDPGWGSQ